MTRRILLVDDDKLGLKTLAVFARKMGYDVRTAANGSEAWELWQREAPPVVVTDWMMPEMDGPSLVRQIRAAERDEYTYIVMVTERHDAEDLVEGFDAGVDDYLGKPVRRDEFMVRLRAGERVLQLQSKETVIFALAKLAEAKDTETGFHLERIQNYCRALAEWILASGDAPAEVSRSFVDSIYRTSPLHDIGKVGIPDHILLKPGRLDDREFEHMKRHTVIGADTLASAHEQSPHAGYLEMAAAIARHHHEKWDGSGYPEGLAGEEIPLAARIVALADVYDALVSRRAYKGAFPHETARAIILEGEGQHFDPFVVKAFLACEEDFVAIRERFAAA